MIYAMQYDPAYVQWNLNTAVNATNPLDYAGVWENHTFNPSPDNWRFPFYTIMLDRFVNGDPMNDNANGTIFEHDLGETQLRHGGDIRGLQDSLDYLQGMGIKVILCTTFTNCREYTVPGRFLLMHHGVLMGIRYEFP
jgi:alpha-1,3-glucan synthase